MSRNPPVLAMAVVVLVSVGCGGIGPATLNRDHFEYTEAISDSWKRQMLLNIVKLRYGDAPVFLEVSSVITQYSLQAQANAGISFGSPQGQQLGATANYSDRPTVTYGPMTGERFARSLMSPIPPRAVLSLIQAGYPVELVLRICVQSINGIRNRYGGVERVTAVDPRFVALLNHLVQIQSAGGLAMRVERPASSEEETVLVFRPGPSSIEGEVREAERLLGLDGEARELRVIYGSTVTGAQQLALLTRSVLQVLIDLSSYVDVPLSDVAEHRTHPTVDPAPLPALVRFHSSRSKPPDALVSVSYRGRWFWVDDRDVQSKVVFNFLTFIFTLTESDSRNAAPAVVLPVGG
jgi:hypothetical protein